MGILLVAQIVEKLWGMALRDFEKQEIFRSLGMKDSSLGLGGRRISELVSCAPAPGTDPADDARFGPNTLYSRDMGCPWGGMHSTTSDIATLLQTVSRRRRAPRQTRFQPSHGESDDIGPECGRRPRGDLGGRLGARAWNAFGDLVSEDAFGHVGATGTMAWADPATQLVCVILTNRPYSVDDGRFLRLVSNAVAASVQ